MNNVLFSYAIPPAPRRDLTLPASWREMRRANRNADKTFSAWCCGCNRQAILLTSGGAIVGHDGPCRDRWTQAEVAK